jgi:hypothetical protein
VQMSDALREVASTIFYALHAVYDDADVAESMKVLVEAVERNLPATRRPAKSCWRSPSMRCRRPHSRATLSRAATSCDCSGGESERRTTR